jgi:hypothetical protein
VGLIPILRKVWARRGKRPTASSKRQYKWLYIYGFVHPATGRTFWLLFPTVNVTCVNIALELFANEVGAGTKKLIVLVWDGAGFHRSKDLRVPEGIRLVQLPPYSPELQPAEHLWEPVKKSLANKQVNSIDELKDVLGKQCRSLSEKMDEIKQLTNFDWWPSDPVYAL